MLALKMTATVIVEWQHPDRQPSTQSKHYEYTTTEMSVEYWANDNGARFNEGLSECLNNIIEMTAWDLAPDQSLSLASAAANLRRWLTSTPEIN
jgi:hypothetical protein